ncbi:MAG: hypothetical protein ACYCPW_12565 [Nitrososphaerales archaeon]
MIFSANYLQFGNNVVDLVEWFVASVAILLVVTLIYVFVLNKSPRPEGMTQARLESSAMLSTPESIIFASQDALKSGDNIKAVELSVKAVGVTLATLLSATGVDLGNMNTSDMAYLVQTRATRSPDITQPIYQLNLLHLKAAQSQQITIQEAEWAINTANWLSQLVTAQHISF